MLYLVRHGDTNWNEGHEDRIRGHRDIPLNAEGLAHAHRIATVLAGRGPIDMVVSSDLQRARRTADVISQHTGAPHTIISASFRPWDVGRLTGADSKAAIPVLMRFVREAPDRPVPDGESFDDFRHRFLTSLRMVLDHNPSKSIAVVAHHRNDRVLAGWVANGQPGSNAIITEALEQHGIRPGGAQPYVRMGGQLIPERPAL